MQTFYPNFLDIVRSARANPLWSESAKLILFGRIAYAVERGDLTVEEGHKLMDMMEQGIRKRYDVPLQLAMFGENEEQLNLIGAA